jgi:hypothetical protein
MVDGLVTMLSHGWLARQRLEHLQRLKSHVCHDGTRWERSSPLVTREQRERGRRTLLRGFCAQQVH